MSRAMPQYAMRFMKRAYYRAQHGACGICSKKMGKAINSSRFGFDHVWPKSKTTANSHDACHGNLLLCHTRCNLAKADRPPTEAEVKFLYVTNRMLSLPAHETALWDTIEKGSDQNEPEHQQCGDAAAQRAS